MAAKCQPSASTSLEPLAGDCQLLAAGEDLVDCSGSLVALITWWLVEPRGTAIPGGFRPSSAKGFVSCQPVAVVFCWLLRSRSQLSCWLPGIAEAHAQFSRNQPRGPLRESKMLSVSNTRLDDRLFIDAALVFFSKYIENILSPPLWGLYSGATRDISH